MVGRGWRLLGVWWLNGSRVLPARCSLAAAAERERFRALVCGLTEP